MNILEWIILGAFAGSLFAAVLSVVFREDLRVMKSPQPHLLAISVALLMTGVITDYIWIVVRMFGLWPA